MRKIVKNFFRKAGVEVSHYNKKGKVYRALFQKYRNYTMMDQNRFSANLELCDQFKNVEGDYAECGVWRGGMSAAIAEIIGKEKEIHLFDSFEGLPLAKEIDGEAALHWQRDKNSPTYFDNCSAEKRFAIEAMVLADHQKFNIYPGWFAETIPNFGSTKLSILRLDGDWYDSILISLKYLYPMVVENGLIILDDYPYWAGCSRAVHKYLADISSVSRIHEMTDTVTYILKKDKLI
ncbi:MAG: TylF/MycF/NovP-related O-methyltransferase [Bacteroidota bacterium]